MDEEQDSGSNPDISTIKPQYLLRFFYTLLFIKKCLSFNNKINKINKINKLWKK